ncbi:MAG TPA: glucose 1-dehydrogenase [Bacteroidia bacterium]|nr:glucose 1-dehydrogenase [Bacteroidia bacterium]
MNRLKNKVAIITGAAGGMGKAESLLFAKEGARVMATDKNEQLLRQWAESARQEGLQIEWMAHDVTSAASWSDVVQKTVEKFGGIDILVNNAGVFPAGATTENTELSGWESILSINLTGPFIGVKSCLPYLKKNGGSVVNVASIAANVGGNGPAYTASKGGLRLLTKDMAIEFAPHKIRVNSLHPGGVKTPMTAFFTGLENAEELVKNSCPQGRMAEPEELAMGALFLAGDESSFMTGAELVIDGGLIAR